jgi:cytochrome b6-f complex iron-sulfur subunit
MAPLVSQNFQPKLQLEAARCYAGAASSYLPKGAIMEDLTRRDLLVAAGAVAVASCAALQGCQIQEKDKPTLITTGTVNIGPASDFPAGRANLKFLTTYGIIIANDSGTRVAIRPKCTHQGCIAEWDEKARGYECPCHGAKFTMLGIPLPGPAKKPLPLVACAVEADGTLTVDLTKLYGL